MQSDETVIQSQSHPVFHYTDLCGIHPSVIGMVVMGAIHYKWTHDVTAQMQSE